MLQLRILCSLAALHWGFKAHGLLLLLDQLYSQGLCNTGVCYLIHVACIERLKLGCVSKFEYLFSPLHLPEQGKEDFERQQKELLEKENIIKQSQVQLGQEQVRLCCFFVLFFVFTVTDVATDWCFCVILCYQSEINILIYHVGHKQLLTFLGFHGYRDFVSQKTGQGESIIWSLFRSQVAPHFITH